MNKIEVGKWVIYKNTPYKVNGYIGDGLGEYTLFDYCFTKELLFHIHRSEIKEWDGKIIHNQ